MNTEDDEFARIAREQALNKMADNARELGLDYKPAQQEPVAWMHPDGRIWTFGRGLDKSTFTVPLYTSPPPQRTWVGLTDEEVWDLWNSYTEEPFPEWFVDFKRSYKVLEAKLKEKNT